MQEVVKLYKHVTRYQHVERLGNDEVQGILQGTVWIQEKLDGANLSVSWDPETNDFIVCSRQNLVYHDGLCSNKSFQPVVDYIKNEPEFEDLLKNHPNLILRGEYLTKHKVPFKPEFEKKFAIFDVEHTYFAYDEELDGGERCVYVPYPIYKEKFIDKYTNLIWVLATEFKNPTIEQLQGLSKLDSDFMEYREGIVIKNYDFTNKFGFTKWGKVISPIFDEKKALKARAKLEVGELEQAFVDKFVTPGYVEKEIYKLRMMLDGSLSIKDMNKIIGIVPYQIFQDEMWRFLSKANAGEFNFRLWRSATINRVREIALSYFNKPTGDSNE